ncbi:unnamed protein product [Sympodiomycopsis kandeliae]
MPILPSKMEASTGCRALVRVHYDGRETDPLDEEVNAAHEDDERNSDEDGNAAHEDDERNSDEDGNAAHEDDERNSDDDGYADHEDDQRNSDDDGYADHEDDDHEDDLLEASDDDSGYQTVDCDIDVATLDLSHYTEKERHVIYAAARRRNRAKVAKEKAKKETIIKLADPVKGKKAWLFKDSCKVKGCTYRPQGEGMDRYQRFREHYQQHGKTSSYVQT